jgi:hypothetical protein
VEIGSKENKSAKLSGLSLVVALNKQQFNGKQSSENLIGMARNCHTT